MKLKFLVTAVLCFFIFNAFSQNKQKTHYEIIASPNMDISLYKKILDNTFMDSLRFHHERRTIEFTNAPIKVVLYSAEELYAKYGKIVSELTIEKPYKARKVKFRITENNQIQVIGQ